MPIYYSKAEAVESITVIPSEPPVCVCALTAWSMSGEMPLEVFDGLMTRDTGCITDVGCQLTRQMGQIANQM